MVLFRVLFALTFVVSCFGLQCFECENVELDTDNSIVKSIIGSVKTNTACASTTFDALDNKVNVRTCSSGQVCGFVKGEVTFDVPFGGSVGAKVHTRSCIASSQRSGCVTDNTKIESILSFVAKFTNVKIDADLCFCDYDLCVSGGCGDDKYAIGPICMLKWLVYVIGGGVLLLIIGLIICCCCCCCRSKNTPGVIMVGAAPPAVGVIQQQQTLAQGYMRMEEPQLKNYAV